MDLLDKMKGYAFAVLFIGLIFSIIIMLFVMISTLLIYSLLMITIETKAFENGIMRMQGLSKAGFSGMILLQANLFVLPSIACAFVVIVPILYGVFSLLFTEEEGFSPSLFPTAKATIEALVIGLVIPLASAIVPIHRAISKSLADSLNPQRSSPGGVKISITNLSLLDSAPLIMFGCIATVYGISVYYILPLALLSGGFQLLLIIFFVILMGMVLGLTLIAFNL